MTRTKLLDNFVKKSIVVEQAQWDSICEIASERRVPRTQVIREALDVFLALNRTKTTRYSSRSHPSAEAS